MRTGIFAALALAAAAATAPASAETISITVADQKIEDGTVKVERVYVPGPGWLVMHRAVPGAEALERAGEPIAHVPVAPGENLDLVITTSEELAPEDEVVLVLHEDDGARPGEFDAEDSIFDVAGVKTIVVLD